ncbi:MAG: HEAT repeat domain-containing protein [Planctomycetota bacterium]
MVSSRANARALVSMLKLVPFHPESGRDVVLALRAMGQSAVPALVEALASSANESFHRAAAAWLLGRVGGPRAVSALRAARDDLDAAVAQMAQEALDHLGVPATAEDPELAAA